MFENISWKMEKLLAVGKQNFEGSGMITSNNNQVDLPNSVLEARNIFKKICLNKDGDKSSTHRMLANGYEQYSLTCTQNQNLTSTQFIFTTTKDASYLVDLQVIQVSNVVPNLQASPIVKSNSPPQVSISVGLSTLDSGPLARNDQYEQGTKTTDDFMSENMVAMAKTLLHKSGIMISEKEATVVGIGLTVITAGLKEIYNSRYGESHPTDSESTIVAKAVNSIGDLSINLKFVF